MNQLYAHIKKVIDNKPKMPVFIFDYDGTLSDGGHRLAYLPTENLHLTESWSEFNRLSQFDAPFEDTIQVMKACHQIGLVIILTGRSDEVQVISQNWLTDNGADCYDFLVMRSASDNRKDTVIKEEFLRSIGLERIIAAWDDSPKVIEHFRSLGITTYQVCDYGEKANHAHLQSNGCDHEWDKFEVLGGESYYCCALCGKSSKEI